MHPPQQMLPNPHSNSTIKEQVLDSFPLVAKPTSIIVNHVETMKYVLHRQSVMTGQPQSESSFWSIIIIEKQFSLMDHRLGFCRVVIEELHSELFNMSHFFPNLMLHIISFLKDCFKYS